ncbi:MAG: shikimate dehydrogenase [Rikenellaceae bacterium]
MREFALIGRHLPHSFSAKYFAAKFEREGIQDAKYDLCEMETIAGVEQLLARENLVGFNVTIPYKLEIIPYLSRLSPEAEAVGAVNCVSREGGELVGYNTDVIGFRDSLVEFLDGEKIDRALVLGGGGASLAVKYILSQLGVEYQQVSRKASAEAIAYEDVNEALVGSHKLIVNATPLGTFPNVDSAPDIPYHLLDGSHYLYDLVYNPPCTKFLTLGRARGCKTCNGEQMLTGQAEAAWRIWNRER